VGRLLSPTVFGRPALAVALFGVISAGIPQPGVASPAETAPGAPLVAARIVSLGDEDPLDPAAVVRPYRDEEAKVSILPPRGWTLSPATSLDRTGDDDLYEVVRSQLRVGDATLYAQPVPVTSGLLADAGAVLSIALAREASDLDDIDIGALDPESVQQIPGATAIDSETSYDGVVTFTRILVARETGRTAVIRAFVPSAERDALAPLIASAISSATIDAAGPLGPRYVAPVPPPPPPAPAPEPVVAPVDPSAGARAAILERAAGMLGSPYVWGGNSVARGMDCSAYVSAAWGVVRYSTDSIWNVAVAIRKDQLLPGDAMDLETWRDPARKGHIRLFEAWANVEHTLVWVYEETPPRAIHRVIAYDARYQPIRLAWLSGDGTAPLRPAPAAMPAPRLAPQPASTRRPAAATPRPTARPTAVRTPRPTATVRPAATPRPAAATPRPATATPRPAATARPAATRVPAGTPRPTATAVVQATSIASAPARPPARATQRPRPTAAPTHR
jgi:cell wall-associated NlpC family hydrolase